MRHITRINVFHIVSEPGDMTRYDYMINQNGPDDFTIAPVESTFAFPQRLDYHVAKNILDSDVKALWKKAEEMKVNPYTLKEVCGTIVEIKEGLTKVKSRRPIILW